MDVAFCDRNEGQYPDHLEDRKKRCEFHRDPRSSVASLTLKLQPLSLAEVKESPSSSRPHPSFDGRPTIIGWRVIAEAKGERGSDESKQRSQTDGRGEGKKRGENGRDRLVGERDKGGKGSNELSTGWEKKGRGEGGGQGCDETTATNRRPPPPRSSLPTRLHANLAFNRRISFTTCGVNVTTS